MRKEHNQDDIDNEGQGNNHEFYQILVDHKPHKWPNPTITGTEIKQLAGVDQRIYEAWQDIPGPDDKLIGDTLAVDLSQKGTEKFFTIKATTTEG